MKRTRWMRAAVSLLFLVMTGVAAADWAGAQSHWQQEAERSPEADGWRVAYSSGIHEEDAGRGEVAPGISIFAVRGTMEMMRLHDWANALVQQAVALAGIRSLGQDEQFQVMRFTVRTVRELIRERRSGSNTVALNGLEFKAGVLEQRGSGRLLVPYAALRATSEQGGGGQQEQSLPNASADPFNALRLTNTARQISSGNWEWTAFIDGPASLLGRVRSVTYHLHPTFNPSRQQGDSSRPGHPLTALGWGTFLLRADAELDDGTRRSFEHMLQFH